MKNRDQRPLASPMPDHLMPISDRHGMAAAALPQTVFREVAECGVDRPAAELENDALSLASQVVSMAVVSLAVQLAACKGVPLEQSVQIALADVNARTFHSLELAQAAEQAKGATRQ